MNPQNRRLLIVDDEPEIRRGYRSALIPSVAPQIQSSRASTDIPENKYQTRLTFELVEAENGDKALEILLTELAVGRHFAGAIVDVRMPGRLDGLQFIKEAWKLDPDLQIVVATAYQDRSVDEIDRIFSAQFQDQWDYLSKPFSAGEIIQKARHIVSSWNRRQRERQHLAQITEQQQSLIAQEKLAAIGRLARSVGHEFGNVLQPLITKLEIARLKVDEAMHPMFDEMTEAAELGSHICQDLLTFARENHETSNPPEINLLSPVQSSLRILSHNFKLKDARVHVAVPEDLVVKLHESKLAQIIINLLTNSLDALPVGGEIRIEAGKKASGEIELVVSDNGCGIPAHVQHLVFQPLFTTKGKKGNGLGLAVCKQIIEEYSGRILIDSTVNSGTRMVIVFPS